MATIAEAIEIALVHHRAGDLDAAEQIYRQILQATPRHAAAMHLLGLASVHRGRYQLAVELISQAIRLDGVQATFHANLGEAYRGLARFSEAKACYRQALRLMPELAEAHNNLGTILQADGQAAEAIECYQQAIALRPNYADAYNNLGTLYQDQGQWPQAIECYRAAVAAEPRYARGYYNLGLALQVQGQGDEATAAFRQAIELQGDYAEAHCGLATVFHRQRHFAEAEAAYREAIRLRPSLVEASTSLGTLFQEQDRLAEAMTCYQQAIEARPGYAPAHYNLGTVFKAQAQLDRAADCYRRAIDCNPNFADAHYNLGTVLQEQGRLDEAAAAYQAAVRVQPDYPLAYNNLGNIYKTRGDAARAIECYEQALLVAPEHGEAFNNLGSILQGQGKLAETVECYRHALRSKPASAEIYSNLGTAWQENGQFSKALACYEKSLKIEPNFPEAHFNRGLLSLAHERFVEGWDDFAWRLQCRHYPARNFSQPLWDGSPLEGRTLLVHAEQGLGDTLHFIRYVPELRQRGGRLVVEVQPSLVALLRRSGFDEVVARGSPLGEFDLYMPMLSLPGIFRTTVETIPADVPYLTADPKLVDAWREKLSQHEGLRVGIHWQGNRIYAFDRDRSIPFREFAPLASVAGVELFSLQKGEGAEQLDEAAGLFPIHDLGPELDEQTGGFMDTAAVMKNLDLVVTSDTVTAHLAGGLGIPVWVALGSFAEWRWLLDRKDSPWYPGMRLFRQSQRGDWSEVFAHIARELETLAARAMTTD